MATSTITLAGQQLSLDAARLVAAGLVADASAYGVRFGDHKVFLGTIPCLSMSDPACRAWLDDLRRAGLCTFARADLVAAMDPELVEASEWRLDGATYHFLMI